MTSRPALLALLLGACSLADVDGGHQALEQGAAGMSAPRMAGASSTSTATPNGPNAASDGAYRVRLHADRVTLCPGECARLSATVENGAAPFSFAWSGVSDVDGEGPVEVCPTESTTYRVTATDSWSSVEEFGGEDRSAGDSVQIAVRDDCEPAHDAAPGQVLCSHRFDWEIQSWVEVHIGVGSGAKLAADAQGNVYFSGSFVHTADVGFGPMTTASSDREEGFVMKLGPSCEPLWIKRFSGDASTHLSTYLTAVDRDGNLIVVGHLIGTVDFGLGAISTVQSDDTLTESIVVLKLDPDGNPFWNHRYTSGYGATYAYDLGVSDAGDVVISGYGGTELHYDDMPVSGAPEYSSMFIASLDKNGAHRFIHHVRGDAPGGSIDVMPSGNTVVSGWTYDGGSTVSGIEWGGPIWENFLFTLDASGNLLWSDPIERMGDGQWSGLYSFALAHDREQNILLDQGYSTSLEDGTWLYAPRILRKLDGSGAERWARTRQYLGGEQVYSQAEIAVDSSNNIAHIEEIFPDITIDGESFTVRGDADFLVRKRDADGELLWSTQLGSEHRDDVLGLIADSSDALWVAYNGDIDGGNAGEVMFTKLAP